MKLTIKLTLSSVLSLEILTKMGLRGLKTLHAQPLFVTNYRTIYLIIP
jgi:hypothetical protein